MPISRDDWKKQYGRARRWLDRFENLHIQDIDDPQYFEDVVFTCFQNLYHLRDWLQNSGVVTKTEIDSFLLTHKSNDLYQLCHDICLGSKHLKITTPGADPDIQIGYFVVPVLGGVSQKACMLFTIHANGGIFHAFNVAKEVLNFWDDFLSSKGLI